MNNIYIDQELNDEINNHINLLTELSNKGTRKNKDLTQKLYDSLCKLVNNEFFLPKFLSNQVIILIFEYIFIIMSIHFFNVFATDYTHINLEIYRSSNQS